MPDGDLALVGVYATRKSNLNELQKVDEIQRQIRQSGYGRRVIIKAL